MKTIAILSGGMDSTVLAYYLSHADELCGCVSVNYGQRHAKELKCAERTCLHLDVPHHLIDLSNLRNHIGNSALTGDNVAVPYGHYAAESMKQTVVPNRNMILMALAVGVAINEGAEAVAYGAHAGDHAIYPDCRPRFADAMANAIWMCDYKPMSLLRPFIDKTKADIVSIGIENNVNFGNTWTCYEGRDIACGRCGTCVERLEAFDLAGYTDPLTYADRISWREIIKRTPTPVKKLIGH